METKETRRKPARRPGATATRRPAPKKAAPAKRPAPRKKPAQPARSPRPDAEIVYTPAKPFNRNRLLLQLGITAAVVLAVFLSLTLFFKVGDILVSNHGSGGIDINVSGNGRYSAETIVEASGIRKGDGLLSLNKAHISGQIITKLPYVKSVRIGIKLPDTVNIEIEELDVVYAISEADGTWWLMNSGGKLIEKIDAAAASVHTKVLGVELDMPVVGQMAVARQDAPTETMPEGETMPVTISNAQRLQTAVTILQYLEDNDVMGEVVSVDVTDMGSVKLQYGQRFQIQLGDTTQLGYKIEMALAAVKQLAEHDRGTLDVSFMARQEVVYTPRAD